MFFLLATVPHLYMALCLSDLSRDLELKALRLDLLRERRRRHAVGQRAETPIHPWTSSARWDLSEAVKLRLSSAYTCAAAGKKEAIFEGQGTIHGCSLDAMAAFHCARPASSSRWISWPIADQPNHQRPPVHAFPLRRKASGSSIRTVALRRSSK